MTDEPSKKMLKDNKIEKTEIVHYVVLSEKILSKTVFQMSNHFKQNILLKHEN